jgi:hypothetical protein
VVCHVQIQAGCAGLAVDGQSTCARIFIVLDDSEIGADAVPDISLAVVIALAFLFEVRLEHRGGSNGQQVVVAAAG